MGRRIITILWLGLLFVFLSFLFDQLFISQLHAASVNFNKTDIDPNFAGDVKVAGDIDGDGFADLAVGGYEFYWYQAPNWQKHFIATAANQFTTDGKMGDVDGDGDLDIVVPDGPSGTNLIWLENPANPQAGPWPRHSIGGVGDWGKDVHLADFDGNTRLDVAVRVASSIFIFFQTAPNTWNRVTIASLGGGEGMGAGDIDKDGDVDLVGPGFWLERPTNPVSTPWPQHNIVNLGFNEFKAEVADIDQNGTVDVLYSCSECGSAQEIAWFEASNPQGTWTRHVIANLSHAHTLQVADMDLDGDLDVVSGQMVQSSQKELNIYLNAGNSLNWTKMVVDNPVNGIHNGVVVDIGNDGDYDIFGSNWLDFPPVSIWENQPGEEVNQPPLVNAGNDQVITLPTDSTTLNGAVTDDGLPSGSTVTTTWTQISGPTSATISNPSNLTTDVTLPAEGSYTFRLTASDTELTGSDEVTVELRAASQTSVLGYWALNEGSGTTTADGSGNGHPGTINGATWTSGKVGNALAFDGVDDNVNLGSLNVSGQALTLAAWVNASAFAPDTDHRIVSKSSGSAEQDHYWMFGTVSLNDKLRFRLKTDDNTWTLIANNSGMPTNQWVHVAAVYDGATMKLYQDGIEVGSTNRTGTISSSNSSVLIGSNANNYGVWNGLIDEVYIFETALSQSQIQELMNSTPEENVAPVAQNLSATTAEDTSVAITLVATDEDSDPLTYAIVTQPSNGVVTVSGSTATYTPQTDSHGSDSFTYKANDGTADSNTATVSLTVSPVNDAPVAEVTATPSSGQAPLTVAFDASASTDVDGDPLTYDWDFGDGATTTGSATVTHEYTTAGDYVAVVTVGDGIATDTAQVSIQVGTSSNNPPVADDQSVNTDEDNAIDITLTASDAEGNPLIYSIVDQPTQGAVNLNGNIVTYTPNTDYHGADSFTYKANDGVADSNIATVSITVNPVNDAPTADFTATPSSGQAPLTVAFDASASTDVDGDPLTYDWDFGDTTTGSGVTAGHEYGTAGEYTVTLTVTDSEGASDTETVTISVTEGGGGPVAAYSFDEGTGTTTADSAGTHDGNINGATWTTGKSGQALLYDAVDDHVNLGDLDVEGDQLTITAWVYSNGSVDDDRIISKTSGGGEQEHFWMVSISGVGNDAKLRFRLKTNDHTDTLIGDTNLPANQWVHVAAVYNGSQMELYQNGVLVGSTNKTGTISQSDLDVLIGANPDNYSVWNGIIDELTIYEQALSATTIADLASQ